MKQEDKSIIFREAPLKMIVAMGKSDQLLYKTEIAKRCDITYSHVVNTVDKLEKIGIVKIHNKEGRLVWVELTKKGNELYKAIMRL